jgi:hypothetical protein
VKEMNSPIRGSETIALIGLVDVLGRGQRVLPIREHRLEGRLVDVADAKFPG